MSYPVSAPQQAALEKPVVPMAWFIQLDFSTGTQRLCNFNRTVTWGGFDWIGLGALGSISEIKSSEKIEPNSVTFTLTASQAAWLTFGIGDVEVYRGRSASVYTCPLDEGYQLIGAPLIVWAGEMDIVAVSIEGQGGSISLRCEPTGKRLRRSTSLRVNAAQQRARYNYDSGFDFQIDLMSNPQTWLSKKFQTVA